MGNLKSLDLKKETFLKLKNLKKEAECRLVDRTLQTISQKWLRVVLGVILIALGYALKSIRLIFSRSTILSRFQIHKSNKT